MPLYDYYCGKCDIEKEVNHKMNEQPKIYCDKCGKEMRKTISQAATTIYKGQWFKNSGKY